MPARRTRPRCRLISRAYTLGMPISPALESALATFKHEQGFVGVGSMGTALIITRRARRNGLPLDPDGLNTPGGGQVAGGVDPGEQPVAAMHRMIAEVGEHERHPEPEPAALKLPGHPFPQVPPHARHPPQPRASLDRPA